MRAKLAAAVALAAAAAVPVATGATAAPPVWLSPVELSTRADGSVFEQAVAIDAHGGTLVVWAGGGSVESRFRPSGGAWQGQVELAPCGYGARVASDGLGGVTVAWLQCTPDAGGSWVMAATRRADGTWSTPVQLSTPGRIADSLRIAVASSGVVAATWRESDGHVWVVEADVRPAGGESWERPVQLSAVGADAFDPVPAVNSRGDAVVGWTRGDPAGAIVWAALRSGGGAWGAAVNLSQPGSSAYPIEVAMTPGGDALAVWQENGRGRWAERNTSTTAWSVPQPFAAVGVSLFAFDRSGNAFAVWAEDGITAAELPVGADRWQPPFKVSSQSSYPVTFQVSFDDAGGMVAIWGTGDALAASSISAARRPAGSADWQGPVRLPSVPGTVDNASYAFDAAGDAVAVYETPSGASVAVAVLDAAAPRLAAPKLPPAARAGRRLSLSASAADFTGVTVRWHLGDGRAATGAHVVHTYRRPGRYRVIVTATDAAGHVTSAARTLRVAPAR